MKLFARRATCAWAFVLLAGCSTVPVEGSGADIADSPWAAQSTGSAGAQTHPPRGSGWSHIVFPGKQATKFSYARKDGRDSVAVLAASSASALRSTIRIEPKDLGNVRFSWKVPELIVGADMALRETDDSPVRVVLTFEGDRSRFSARDGILSELMLTLTGEKLPYATLMYVWCNQRAPGDLIANPRTGRIRKLVVQSGSRQLNQWLDYERDIRADFERAFGEAPGALVGIGIMTDSDNTRTTARAWYGPLRLSARKLRQSGD
jgi:hypothetical protein